MGRPAGFKNKPIHTWSTQEKEYLEKITPGRQYKEIAELMNKKFELEFTTYQIKGAIARYKLNTGLTGQFQKGHTPFNKGQKGTYAKGCEKTWFPKGNKPHNYLPVGTERVNGDGYIEIKIVDPSKWRAKHILIWEEHNGPLPKNHAIIFGDKDNRNFNLNNLILVSRQQLLMLNRNKLIKNDAELTRTGIIIADLYQKINKRRKENE